MSDTRIRYSKSFADVKKFLVENTARLMECTLIAEETIAFIREVPMETSDESKVEANSHRMSYEIAFFPDKETISIPCEATTQLIGLPNQTFAAIFRSEARIISLTNLETLYTFPLLDKAQQKRLGTVNARLSRDNNFLLCFIDQCHMNIIDLREGKNFQKIEFFIEGGVSSFDMIYPTQLMIVYYNNHIRIVNFNFTKGMGAQHDITCNIPLNCLSPQLYAGFGLNNNYFVIVTRQPFSTEMFIYRLPIPGMRLAERIASYLLSGNDRTALLPFRDSIVFLTGTGSDTIRHAIKITFSTTMQVEHLGNQSDFWRYSPYLGYHYVAEETSSHSTHFSHLISAEQQVLREQALQKKKTEIWKKEVQASFPNSMPTVLINMIYQYTGFFKNSASSKLVVSQEVENLATSQLITHSLKPKHSKSFG